MIPLEQPLDRIVWMIEHSQKEMLDGDILVLHTVGNTFRRSEHPVELLRNVNFSCFTAWTADCGKLIAQLLWIVSESVRINLHRGQKLRNQSLILIQKRKQEMLLVQAQSLPLNGKLLCGLDCFQ